MYAPRRHGGGRTRILYWFRTPPGIRVGRAALDEDAIRLMEEHHPTVRFDWPQILRGEDEPGPQVPPRSPRPTVIAEPESIDGATSSGEPINAAHARLGSGGLARLRARYANVMAAISRRVIDPDRQELLRADAERLNPDNWVTDDEVRQGLEQYETVFESLRGVIGRRRRRRRSRLSAPDEAAAGQRAPDGVEATDARRGEDLDGDGIATTDPWEQEEETDDEAVSED